MRRDAISFWLKPGQFRLLEDGTDESPAGDFDFAGEKRGQEIPDDNRAPGRGTNDSATTEQFHPVETSQENGPDRWRRTVMIALGGDAYLIASRWWSRAFFRYPHTRPRHPSA